MFCHQTLAVRPKLLFASADLVATHLVTTRPHSLAQISHLDDLEAMLKKIPCVDMEIGGADGCAITVASFSVGRTCPITHLNIKGLYAE